MLPSIEDLILHICDPFTNLNHSKIEPRDKSVLFSFAAQLRKPLPFTERQANLALKILERNRESYLTIQGFTHLLEQPIYKYPFRTVDPSKKISIIEANGFEHISVKFPFNLKINNALSAITLKKVYDKKFKAFLLPLTEQNILKIIEFGRSEFDIDAKLISYYEKIRNIIENSENHVPCIDYNGSLTVKNLSKAAEQYFENNSNGELLHDVFLAKFMGLTITTPLKAHIDSILTDNLTRSILFDGNRRFSVKNYNNIDISKSLSIIGHWPVMVMMSDDSTSTSVISQWTHSLKSVGVENRFMSVLFRSQTDKSFNDFVKNNNLNNLVTEETKVVFIKYKTPKILYKINFNPKIVISTSSFYAHFTNQRTIDYHPLVLYYTDQTHPNGNKIAKL